MQIWDVRDRSKCVRDLVGHKGEISGCQFNWAGDQCISGSSDKEARVWDVRSGRCLSIKRGHTDEVLDVSFNSTGSHFVTAGADGTARLYNTCAYCAHPDTFHILYAPHLRAQPSLRLHLLPNTKRRPRVLFFRLAATGTCEHVLEGHAGEISKVQFNAAGTKIVTASSDNTARLWDTLSGEQIQVLTGHSDEIFSCSFNYEGDYIITGSKDNTCRIWKATDEA